MASIAPSLQRIKRDLTDHLSPQAIYQACRDTGYRFRRRKLDPAGILHLFILQVLCFNTAISHLRHIGKMTVSGAAYCRGRMRLPLAVLQRLLRTSADSMLAGIRNTAKTGRSGSAPSGDGRWCGLRTFLTDASSTITPHTPSLDKHFGHPTGQRQGCSLPVAKVLGLFDAFSGLVIEVLCMPLFVHEMSQIWRLHPLLGRGDLVVGDRGFCSFVHLVLLSARNVMACFRLHGRRKETDFRRGKRVRRLGKHDRIVRWEKPKLRPKWMNAKQYGQLPQWLEVRLIRYQTPVESGRRTRVVTIATTLLDPVLYPAGKIAELYGMRWRVETHFAQLKTTLKMRRLKCKTIAGVQKEIAVYCLVYNLVHLIMTQAAAKQGVTPDRISFIDTVRWLLSAAPGEELPDLLINPRRPGRHEPRVVKDLQDTYRKMVRPRAYLKRHLRLTSRRT
jgi:hypothetical protein